MADIPAKPISIESVALKKGKHDKRFLYADVRECPEDLTCFNLNATKRTFDRWRFPLEEGCLITCGDKSHRVFTITRLRGSLLAFAYEVPAKKNDILDLKAHVAFGF